MKDLMTCKKKLKKKSKLWNLDTYQLINQLNKMLLFTHYNYLGYIFLISI